MPVGAESLGTTVEYFCRIPERVGIWLGVERAQKIVIMGTKNQLSSLHNPVSRCARPRSASGGKGQRRERISFPKLFSYPLFLDLIFLTHHYLFCFLPRRNFTECLQFKKQLYLCWHAVVFISFKRK